MKRILTVTLILVMILTAFTGCKTSQSEDEQHEISQYIYEVNSVYILTLPKSKKEIKFDNTDKVKFVPYITDALVEAAENKINDDTSQFLQ